MRISGNDQSRASSLHLGEIAARREQHCAAGRQGFEHCHGKTFRKRGQAEQIGAQQQLPLRLSVDEAREHDALRKTERVRATAKACRQLEFVRTREDQPRIRHSGADTRECLQQQIGSLGRMHAAEEQHHAVPGPDAPLLEESVIAAAVERPCIDSIGHDSTRHGQPELPIAAHFRLGQRDQRRRPPQQRLLQQRQVGALLQRAEGEVVRTEHAALVIEERLAVTKCGTRTSVGLIRERQVRVHQVCVRDRGVERLPQPRRVEKAHRLREIADTRQQLLQRLAATQIDHAHTVQLDRPIDRNVQVLVEVRVRSQHEDFVAAPDQPLRERGDRSDRTADAPGRFVPRCGEYDAHHGRPAQQRRASGARALPLRATGSS
jgi:hypothetical protein